jgi:uncharacterized protein YjbI with pentapeptide repeats
MNDLLDKIGKEEKYTTLSSETLEEILSSHQKWLESEGKVGERANLSGVNLKYADLSGRNLRLAAVVGANLQFAQLKGANLIDSSLENADLSEAKGLLEKQLGGSNLTATKLPSHISKFESLNRLTDLIKNAKQLNLTIILACLYSWLTIATTTDGRLLSNSISSPLPIIQTEIPIAGFFLVTPFLLLSLYFWFHISLQECWKSFSQCPAFFPDGKSLDEKVYPWIIEGLLRKNFSLLKVKTHFFTWLKVKIFKVLAWYLVPITIFLFWERYLSSREKFGTILLSSLLICTILFGVYSYRMAISTLKHNPSTIFNWKIYIPYKTSFGSISILIIFVTTASFMTFGERRIGFPYLGKNYAILVEEDVSIKPENWNGKEISLVKGANLAGKDLENALAQKAFFVKADLRHANLKGAKITGATFQNANLIGANLEKVDAGWGEEDNKEYFRLEALERVTQNFNKISGSNHENVDNSNSEKNFRANFSLRRDLGANFQKANLVGANLQESVLVFSDFQDADLGSAKIFKGDLRFSNFTRSNLQNANLEETLLSYSNFEGAHLLGLNLEKALLDFTNFQNVTFYNFSIPENYNAKNDFAKKFVEEGYINLKTVGNLRETQLEYSDMRGGNFNLVDLYRANLSYANMENAILYLANLEETILKGASVKNVNFLLTRLHGADLGEVEGLTQEQVNLACLDEGTILPAGLTKPPPCD